MSKRNPRSVRRQNRENRDGRKARERAMRRLGLRPPLRPDKELLAGLRGLGLLLTAGESLLSWYRRGTRKWGDADKPDWWKDLRRLGFSSYEEYRESALWKRLRRRVMEKYGWKCVDCGNKATQAHHERYTFENLRGERQDGIVALCRDCHKARHGIA